MNTLSTQEQRVCASVMGRISHRRLTLARVKASVYGFFLICGAVGIVPAIQYALARAAESGFTDYVSLIASDGSRLSGSWGSLMLSLLDSAPLVGVMLTLLAITVSAYCLQKFMGNRRFLSPSLQDPIHI